MGPRKKKSKPDSDQPVPDSPRERRRLAVELMEQARQCADPRKQQKLALQVTELTPDYGPAWAMLGELAPSDEKALTFYRRAVAVADEQLGREAIRRLDSGEETIDEGHPWFAWRCELAYCLFGVGRDSEAIALLNRLLRLIPQDGSGLRYLLVEVLLRQRYHDELGRLLDRYPDDETTIWTYSRALLNYRSTGDTDVSRQSLLDAIAVNPHVPHYLTSLTDWLADSDKAGLSGGKAEAHEYVRRYHVYWQLSSGATRWVRDVAGGVVQREADPAGTDVPREQMSASEFVRARQPGWKQLLPAVPLLPVAENPDWAIDLVRLPDLDGEPAWLVAVVDGSSRMPRRLQSFAERPRDTEVFDILLEAMLEPTTGQPARPKVIRMRRKGFFRAWQKRLGEVGIRCELVDELPEIDNTANILREGSKIQEEIRQLGAVDDDRIRALPREPGTTWVALVRPFPTWLKADDRIIRPYVRVIADITNSQILSTDMREEPPSVDWVKEGLAVGMLSSGHGDPHRPATIEIDPGEFADKLKPWLEGLDVSCAVSPNPQAIDRLVEDLSDRMTGPGRAPSLVRMTGMPLELVAALFEAAAVFCGQAAWQWVSEETILKIECDAWEAGPWYANVLGASEVEYAVTLYEDLSLLQGLAGGQLSQEQAARRISTLAVAFGSKYELSPDDVEMAHERGWRVAREEFWPNVIRVNPGMSRRAALPWEVELLVACLRAMPKVLTPEGIDSSWQRVETVGREIGIRLSRAES